MTQDGFAVHTDTDTECKNGFLSRREWELLLQQTLGPAFVLVHSASLGVIHLVLFLRRDLIWYCSGQCTNQLSLIPRRSVIGERLRLQPATSSHLAPATRDTSDCVLSLHLIPTRTPSAVRSAGYATRPGTMIRTKGGVGLCFTLFGSSFLFITSHFTGGCSIAFHIRRPSGSHLQTHHPCLCPLFVASDHKVNERNSDMQRIAANLALSDESGGKRKGS